MGEQKNVWKKQKKKWDSREKQAYLQILKLSWPIIIQHIFSAAVSSADIVMLNSVGQAAISAVSLAVQYTNVLFGVYYGLGTGLTMLSAQYWGKGDLKAIEKVQGIALRFSLGISVLFAIPAVLIPEVMMLLFTKDTELIRIGASYLRIVSVSYLCWGISEIFLSTLRSIERVKISTALNVSALLMNIALNAVFIYGLFGVPKLGAAGAALATSVSRAAELVGCFAVSARSKDVKLRLRAMFEKSGILMKDFIRLSLPALGNDIVWNVAFSTYSVIMGHMGTDVVAANSLVVVVRNFGTVLCFSLASAAGILVGKEIGANHFEQAEQDADRAVKLTVLAGVLGGLLVVVVRPFVLSYASLSETAMGYLNVMLWITTYYIMGQAVNTTMVCGIFRAGGDSRFGLVMDAVVMWVYAVPMGFFAAFVLKIPPMWVYFLLCTDEFVKWPVVIRRYRRKKWLNNITRESVTEE